jgi:hypothetical protein
VVAGAIWSIGDAVGGRRLRRRLKFQRSILPFTIRPLFLRRRRKRDRPICVVWRLFSGYFSGMQKVGEKKPNAFELYDMVGNVWQWVQDCWRDNNRGAQSDGSGWTSRVCSSRVVRGGSWYGMNPSDVRSARRDGDPFNYQRNYLGFRVARTLSPSALDLTASVGIGLISPAKNP